MSRLIALGHRYQITPHSAIRLIADKGNYLDLNLSWLIPISDRLIESDEYRLAEKLPAGYDALL